MTRLTKEEIRALIALGLRANGYRKQKEWRKNNPEKWKEIKKKSDLINVEKIKKYHKEWRDSNKDKIREYVYGLSKDEYDAILLRQNGACAICLKLFTKTPHVDHDHKTNKVRGLLCLRCNHLLGAFDESEDWQIRAKEYLYRANTEKDDDD
jgi:hypothetical protein